MLSCSAEEMSRDGGDGCRGHQLGFEDCLERRERKVLVLMEGAVVWAGRIGWGRFSEPESLVLHFKGSAAQYRDAEILQSLMISPAQLPPLGDGSWGWRWGGKDCVHLWAEAGKAGKQSRDGSRHFNWKSVIRTRGDWEPPRNW